MCTSVIIMLFKELNDLKFIYRIVVEVRTQPQVKTRKKRSDVCAEKVPAIMVA